MNNKHIRMHIYIYFVYLYTNASSYTRLAYFWKCKAVAVHNYVVDKLTQKYPYAVDSIKLFYAPRKICEINCKWQGRGGSGRAKIVLLLS